MRINGSAVYQVNINNLFDLTVISKLPWTQNADEIIKKGTQRLFFHVC